MRGKMVSVSQSFPHTVCARKCVMRTTSRAACLSHFRFVLHPAQHVRRDEPGYHNHIMPTVMPSLEYDSLNTTIALSLFKRAATSCCTGQAQLCGDSSGARKLVPGKKRSWNECSGFNICHTLPRLATWYKNVSAGKRRNRS